jgi:hypothetical protein
VIELAQCEKQPCTRAESIRAFLQEAPVEQAFSTPIYSNGAYQVLTYALEAITNRTMSDMITDDVFCPLNMDDSSYSLKANASGIIPNSKNSFWNVPLGDAGATGGVYSSPRDMIKLGQSILNNTQLSPASTRKWLKPWAHTAVWQQAVGLAWEIARWPVDDRIVDVYTKQGDLGMSDRMSFHAIEHSMLTILCRTLPLSLRRRPRIQHRLRRLHGRQRRRSRTISSLRNSPHRPHPGPRRRRPLSSRNQPRRHLHLLQS